MFGNDPRKAQIGHFLRARLTLGDAHQITRRDMAVIAVLDQIAARHIAHGQSAILRIGQAAGQQEAQIFLRRNHLARRLIGIWCNNHLGENRRNRFCRCRIQFSVHGDDAAKGRDRIAYQRFFKRLRQAGAGGDTARIGVFDNGASRGFLRVKFGDQFKRRIRVINIIVRQRLALDLGRRGDADARRVADIKARLLVRVFAIAQGFIELAAKSAVRRHVDIKRARHPIGNRRIICGRAGIGFLGQPLAQGQIRAAVFKRP